MTLRLTRGEDVTGLVTEIDEFHICLDVGNKIVTIFEEILAGWEIHQNSTVSTENVNCASQKRELNVSVIDTKVIEQLTRIQAAFDESLKRAYLEPPEPDFQFPEQEFSPKYLDTVRRDWDKARNQYNYAVKVQELSRLNVIIAQLLRPLTIKYPNSASLHGLLGSLLLKVRHTSEASEYFWKATTISKIPKYWYALTYTAPSESTMKYFALKNYLLTTQSVDVVNVWFYYLNLVLKRSDLDGLRDMIDFWIKCALDLPVKRLFFETIAYVLMKFGQQNGAFKITAGLVSETEINIVENWKEFWPKSNIKPPSELYELEQRFLEESQSIKTLENDNKNRSLIINSKIITWQGKINKFFLDKNFGFIMSDNRQSYFFHLNNVIDDELKQALLNELGEYQSVEFQIIQSPNHERPQAVQIVSTQPIQIQPDIILRRAYKLLEINQHAQAIALIRQIYKLDPKNIEARRLEENIQKQIRTQGIGLPKGEGSYVKAKQAQLRDHNFQEAERLYRIAIEEDNDKTESAVKDLASLLQQQGRSDEAVDLLKSKYQRFSRSNSYKNMLATLYQHLGHYDDAIEVFKLLVNADKNRSQPNLLRQIAIMHFKLGRFDQAEDALRTLLKNYPDYHPTERLLVELQEAKRTGVYTNAEEFFSNLDEEGIELSSLLQDAIHNCTFEGVNPTKIQENSFLIKDVAHLEKLARQLGWQRPRERAAYYLSAASILDKFKNEENTSRIHRDLRRYSASMGDAAWMDHKSADVVRTYYLESLTLVPKSSNETEELFTLMQYFATSVPDQLKSFRDTFFKNNNHLNAVEASLLSANEFANLNNHDSVWQHTLLELCVQSPFGERIFKTSITNIISIQESVKKWFGLDNVSIDNLIEKWCDYCNNYRKIRRQRNLKCGTLVRHRLTVASMEEIGEKLHEIIQTPLWELDRRRVDELYEIVQYSLIFCRASDFEEKEQQYWLVTTRAEKIVEQIRNTPTQFSHESLLPLAKHLKSIIEEEYAKIAQISTPTLDLNLLGDSYTRGYDGEVRLQIQISNKSGCSPASSVRLMISPKDSPYFTTHRFEWEIPSTLRGGSSVAALVNLLPTNCAIEERVFPIKVQALYRNRIDEECYTDEIEWTIRLYDENEYKEINNYYAPYAEGGPVDDPNMFKGRDELLLRLESSLLSGLGNKNIVIFGQKRAGKSSLLAHLKRRLSEKSDCIPISMSLQDIATELSEAAFFHRILYELASALEELRFKGCSVPDLESPKLEDIRTYPSLRFHESMSNLQRQIRRMDGGNKFKFILLIDEFTDIYKQIKKGKIAAEFMKTWKSIVEKRYFSSILVGQDIMPAFKTTYPNEFGVTEDVRITYLAELDAVRLIEEPIGSNRYAGKAIPRILELTAGSPYYTMMLCNRLVDYMNKTRSAIVTEADITAVEQKMLSGDRRLTKDKFDNLVCAGDGLIDSGIDPERTYRLCIEIAKSASVNRGWCTIDTLKNFENDELDVLLSDLVNRDVLERNGDVYRIRVGLFHDWLLIHG